MALTTKVKFRRALADLAALGVWFNDLKTDVAAGTVKEFALNCELQEDGSYNVNGQVTVNAPATTVGLEDA
jgi:hypothetical protein